MSAFTKRLTADDPPKTQPATTCRAVFSNRLLRVLGATRCKPAVLTQKRTQKELVSANNGENYLLHFNLAFLMLSGQIPFVDKKNLLSVSS